MVVLSQFVVKLYLVLRSGMSTEEMYFTDLDTEALKLGFLAVKRIKI